MTHSSRHDALPICHAHIRLRRYQRTGATGDIGITGAAGRFLLDARLGDAFFAAFLAAFFGAAFFTAFLAAFFGAAFFTAFLATFLAAFFGSAFFTDFLAAFLAAFFGAAFRSEDRRVGKDWVS